MMHAFTVQNKISVLFTGEFSSFILKRLYYIQSRSPYIKRSCWYCHYIDNLNQNLHFIIYVLGFFPHLVCCEQSRTYASEHIEKNCF